jgi:hypothetical protein
VHVAVHEHPGCGSAGFPLVVEAAVERVADGAVEVGVVIDDEGVLSAELKQRRGDVSGGGPRDGRARVRRTGELHHAHQRVRRQCLPGYTAGPGYDVQNVGRQHGVEQFYDADDCQRRLLARLEHDGVPDGEGGRDLAAGVDGRPVEREAWLDR